MKRLLGFFGTPVVVAVLAIVATCLLASVAYVWCTEKIRTVLSHFKRPPTPEFQVFDSGRTLSNVRVRSR